MIMNGIDLRVAPVSVHAAQSAGQQAGATRLTRRRRGVRSADANTLIRTPVP